MSAVLPRDAERPTWHRLYYLLAMFDICAVCVSLYMNHKVMGSYIESVAVNRQWSNMQQEVSQLGELAAILDAPGNEVFHSSDIAAEWSKLDQADREFKASLGVLREILPRHASAESTAAIDEDLKTAKNAAMQVVRNATLTMQFFEAGNSERATRHMAAMDQWFFTVNTSLVRVRKRMADLQDDRFDSQSNVARYFQNFEYLIAGMITLMVAGVTYYGRTIARYAAAAATRKEHYRQELEHQVAERTADLSAANRIRGELLKQLITAQEDERARMARDLHDGVGQSLTYLVVGLQRLEDVAAQSTDPIALAKLRSITAQTLDDVRRMARGLRPSILDDFGLTPALENLIEDFSAAHKIEVDVTGNADADNRLPEVIETALYRMVQEALSNIAKHAQATKVTIDIRQAADQINVTVSDNGVGFQVAAANDPQLLKSVGLGSLRERASILGGHTEINSVPGRGATVRIRIPLGATS